MAVGFLPGEWSIAGIDSSTGLTILHHIPDKDGNYEIRMVPDWQAKIIIANKEEFDVDSAWYDAGEDPASGQLREYNPLLSVTRYFPNPNPPTAPPAPIQPVSIQKTFAGPVTGVKAPATAKSEAVASQKETNAAIAEATASTTTESTTTTSTISATSVLEGALVGTGITGTIGVGTVVGAVAGAVSSCVDVPSLVSSKLAELEASLSGALPQLPKLPAVPGLESIGDGLKDAIGAVDDVLDELGDDLTDFASKVEEKVNGFLSDIQNAIPKPPKLPDPMSALGLDSIPCPDTVKADQEATQAVADAKVAKEEEYTASIDDLTTKVQEEWGNVIYVLREKWGVDVVLTCKVGTSTYKWVNVWDSSKVIGKDWYIMTVMPHWDGPKGRGSLPSEDLEYWKVMCDVYKTVDELVYELDKAKYGPDASIVKMKDEWKAKYNCVGLACLSYEQYKAGEIT